jgi:hypothetical protein
LWFCCLGKETDAMANYIVRVRGVEIVCDDLDAVDELVGRYGSEGTAPPKRKAVAPSGAAADTALLKDLVEAGSTGLSSQKIGHMIGARGKGVPTALKRWALRIGLAQDEQKLPLEAARPQGGRGWRLQDGGMSIARQLLEQKA